MKIKYFQDTDTLYIEFRVIEVAETRDLDENTLLDIDHAGNIGGITIELVRRTRSVSDNPPLSGLVVGLMAVRFAEPPYTTTFGTALGKLGAVFWWMRI